MKKLLTFLLLVVCLQAHAALSTYGSPGDAFGRSPQTPTFSSAVANGDLMIMKVQTSTSTTPTVADSVSTGANWALVSGTGTADGTTGYWFYWFWKVMNVTSGTAPVGTVTSAGFIASVNVIAIHGFAGTPAFDTSNTFLQTGTGTSAATTQSTTHAGEILLAMWASSSSFFTATPTGWSNWPSSNWQSVLAGPAASGTSFNATNAQNASSFWVQSEIGIYDATGGSSCTHSFWSSTGVFAVPNGSSGSYWNLGTGTFTTPNCSTGSYLLSTGGSGSN
jgi:hypothetical protein